MSLAALQTALEKSSPGHVFAKASLAERVAYRIGGPADLLLETSSEQEIRGALKLAHEHQVPVTILGNGTNILIRDGGIRGLVIYMGQGAPGTGLDHGVTVENEDDKSILLHVPAHCSKARLLELAIEKTWGGLEFSAGIPGSIGGAVFMNAGTKWGSYGEVIESVRLYSEKLGFFEKKNSEMGFKYRGHGEGLLDGSTVVISVKMRLSKQKTQAEIRALVDEILTYRGARQPLELPNCGSVFKNPENSPRGSGRLIEASGLKGFQIGQAQVSLKHANFILNRGGATAQDVEKLIRHIQSEVFRQQQIQIETEVIILGEK